MSRCPGLCPLVPGWFTTAGAADSDGSKGGPVRWAADRARGCLSPGCCGQRREDDVGTELSQLAGPRTPSIPVAATTLSRWRGLIGSDISTRLANARRVAGSFQCPRAVDRTEGWITGLVETRDSQYEQHLSCRFGRAARECASLRCRPSHSSAASPRGVARVGVLDRLLRRTRLRSAIPRSEYHVPRVVGRGGCGCRTGRHRLRKLTLQIGSLW